ncbi:hypothetical protein KP509_38G013000 [Ceratopteris richardii]|uniref:Uncharacterized protein n=1 Tax=Ceratopteris richardii TaxID=49495 RepID=A0A8T2Q2J9_CERRI|nr:hypothetical protein KP509_38G013000 [Ceratopteris richardii]
MELEVSSSRLATASENYTAKTHLCPGKLGRNRRRDSQVVLRRQSRGIFRIIDSGMLPVKAKMTDEEEPRQWEVRVCTHRTCRKSGSLDTVELLRGLASPNISVESCGCLGRCGMGPNLVILPKGIFVSHCNTPAHVARLLDLQCGLSDPENNLKALSLKQQANRAFESGNIADAETLFSQAINLQPSGGLHLLHSNRSAAWLAKGDAYAALEDAKLASVLAPKWHVPHLRKGEAYMVIGDYLSAKTSYAEALLLDPSLRRSKSYQSKLRELEKVLTPSSAYA